MSQEVAREANDLHDLAEEIRVSLESKRSIHDRIDLLDAATDRLNIAVAQEKQKLAQVVAHGAVQSAERERDRALFSASISDLKKQVGELYSSVSDKLMMQERHFTEQTVSMLDNHSSRTQSLFEKIESRMEIREISSHAASMETDKKIDMVHAQQMKWLGAISVIGTILVASIPFLPFMFSYFADRHHEMEPTMVDHVEIAHPDLLNLDFLSQEIVVEEIVVEDEE